MVQLSLCKHPPQAAREYRVNLHHRFAHVSLKLANSGESCVVLESGPTHSLVTKLPQRSPLAVHEFCATSSETL